MEVLAVERWEDFGGYSGKGFLAREKSQCKTLKR